MNKKLPSISIVVVSYNSESFLPNCLSSIKAQDYPTELIEYINIDGGSTDRTRKLMKDSGFRVIESPIPRNAEAQRAFGLKAARHELLAYIDTDNILPSSQWLKQMVLPFQEDDEIICSQTLRYTYRRGDGLFNRYCALFGVSDPVVFYVGRPDRITWAQKRWVLGDKIEDHGSYYKVSFSEKNLPTVGCNGVIIKRRPLLEYASSQPEQFLHTDVFVDLIQQGFNRFAIVKNDVIHATAFTLKNLVKKRVNFLKYYFGQNAPRRYKIYDPSELGDNIRLALFVIFTITFVEPLIVSIWCYIRLRDRAWFVHPFICWVYLCAYGAATIKRLTRDAKQ